jgi:GGDEF domain-containing protein
MNPRFAAHGIHLHPGIIRNCQLSRSLRHRPRFQERIFKSATNRGAQPWERVSAAGGYALYDPKLDTGTETVLARADREMYRCKRAMKGHAS